MEMTKDEAEVLGLELTPKVVVTRLTAFWKETRTRAFELVSTGEGRYSLKVEGCIVYLRVVAGGIVEQLGIELDTQYQPRKKLPSVLRIIVDDEILDLAKDIILNGVKLEEAQTT